MKTNFKTIETSIGTITMWDNIDEPLPEHEIRGDYKVYKLISPEGKVYYGITRRNVKDRWGKGKHYQFNKELTKDVEKYGWENFAHQILNRDMTQLEALLCESFYIGLSGGIYNPDVYNQTPFGTVCEVHDEETRRKISDKVREYYSTHENPGVKNLKDYNANVKAKPVRCIETGIEYPSVREPRADDADRILSDRAGQAGPLRGNRRGVPKCPGSTQADGS